MSNKVKDWLAWGFIAVMVALALGMTGWVLWALIVAARSVSLISFAKGSVIVVVTAAATFGISYGLEWAVGRIAKKV